MLLKGAVVLVTGASAGLGQVTAERLAARGATVLVHGRDRAALQTLAGRIGGASLSVDLAAPGAAKRLAGQALEIAGRVDLLVANAGLGWAGNLSTMDGSLPRDLIAVNLTAPIELTRE